MRFLVILLVLATGCPQRPRSEPPPPTPPRVHVVHVPIAVAVEKLVQMPAPATPPPADAGISIADLVIPIPDFAQPAGFEATERPLAMGMTAKTRELVGTIFANRIDTGSARGRVVEACYLAQHGLHLYARITLEKVAAAKDCASCADALTAIADAGCPFDAETRAVAKRRSTPIRKAAMTVLGVLATGHKTKQLAQYVDGEVTFTMDCSVCDGDHPPHVKTMQPDVFLRYAAKPDRLAEDGYSYRGPAVLFCDEQCCSGDTGMLNHSGQFITSICFRDPQAPKLTSIGGVSG